MSYISWQIAPSGSIFPPYWRSELPTWVPLRLMHQAEGYRMTSNCTASANEVQLDEHTHLRNISCSHLSSTRLSPGQSTYHSFTSRVSVTSISSALTLNRLLFCATCRVQGYRKFRFYSQEPCHSCSAYYPLTIFALLSEMAAYITCHEPVSQPWLDLYSQRYLLFNVMICILRLCFMLVFILLVFLSLRMKAFCHSYGYSLKACTLPASTLFPRNEAITQQVSDTRDDMASTENPLDISS